MSHYFDIMESEATIMRSSIKSSDGVVGSVVGLEVLGNMIIKK